MIARTMYKSWFCECGKAIRYCSNKQLNFLLIQHKSSRRHQKICGFNFNQISSNDSFAEQMREILN